MYIITMILESTKKMLGFVLLKEITTMLLETRRSFWFLSASKPPRKWKRKKRSVCGGDQSMHILFVVLYMHALILLKWLSWGGKEFLKLRFYFHFAFATSMRVVFICSLNAIWLPICCFIHCNISHEGLLMLFAL